MPHLEAHEPYIEMTDQKELELHGMLTADPLDGPDDAGRSGQVEEMLKCWTDLQSQLALLAHAIRHPNAEYAIRLHMTSHAVAYATARADLFRPADLGLLQRRRVGPRSYRFGAPADFDERIRSAPSTEAES